MRKKKEPKKELVKSAKRDIIDTPEEVMESVIINGDLSKLDAKQKVQYYNAYCSRIGLDPVTKPFEIITLNNKQTLYATRACAQQLNKLHQVSHEIKSRDIVGEVYSVTCRASLPSGRFTDSIGVVSIKGLSPNDLANAIMKAETKSKRRATLDLLGLGILDESEMDTLPKNAITQSEPVRISGTSEKVEPKKQELYSWPISNSFVIPEGDFKGKSINSLLTKQLEYLAGLSDISTGDKIFGIIEERLISGYQGYCEKHKEYEPNKDFESLPVASKKAIMTDLGFNFK
jgi:hypothetical protein